MRVAGWMSPGRDRTTEATISASARGGADRRLGARLDDGAGDGARMRSSPSMKMMLARSRSLPRDDVGGARTVAAHAHVERAVVAEGEAALGVVELHGGDAEIEHHAVDRVEAALGATPSRLEKRPSTSVSRPPAACTSSAPERDGARVAVDGDDRSRGRQHGAAIAAGAEGGVDIDAAVRN